MTAAEFKGLIRPDMCGSFVFCGEEDYLKRRYISLLRERIVDPSCSAFNHVILDRTSYSPQKLSASLAALPMMADRKLIEIGGAEIGLMKDSELDELVDAVNEAKDYGYNVVILDLRSDEIDLGTAKKPSATAKKLFSAFERVDFARESPARLAKWLCRHLEAAGIKPDAAVASYMIDFCGADMFALSSEAEKLTAYARSHGSTSVSREDVEKVCCAAKEIAAFDFANAILDGNADRAYFILNELELKRERPEIVLSDICRVISDLLSVKILASEKANTQSIAKELKMHEYKAGLYLKTASKTSLSKLSASSEFCYEADKKIKSQSLDGFVVLSTLIAQTTALRGI